VLASGLGTAVLALLAGLGLAVTGVLRLVGVPLLASMLRVFRSVADSERDRLNHLGYELLAPPLSRRAVRRELGWLGCHATLGLVLGVLGIAMPLIAVREATFPLWWWLLPPGETSTALGFRIDGWAEVLGNACLGVGWGVLALAVGPGMAALQAWPARRLLAPHPDVDLTGRVAELVATRAAALRAHTVELRRIERALHDGTQNRLAGVVVLLGTARDAVEHDPAGAGATLERAQRAAEEALGELRAVVRSILPPIIADRGLDAALATLAADCPVPCRLTGAAGGGLATSVEATAYFVVAEALTNVVRHSGATSATVDVGRSRDWLRLRISDDGRGGAEHRAGTGLSGMRQRIAAHDGDLTVSSPDGGPTVLEVRLPCGS
jgi:signal transduction histidine kinase